MPELPEVETIVRDLIQSKIVGKRILSVGIYWPRTLGNMTPSAFVSRIKKAKIVTLTRRAKFIVMTLSNGYTLLIHLRMTGRFYFCASRTKRAKHEHVILGLEGGRSLRFNDTRKFGRFYLYKDPAARLAQLGPEPLSPQFSFNAFKNGLQRKSRQIKPLLLDQNFVAGLGNIYTDEALWLAGIHPALKSDSLSSKKIEALHRGIIDSLLKGIGNQGTSLGNASTNYYSVGGRRGRNQDQLNVFRRTGLPCPRCQHIIARIVVAQRSSHICPRCQPL